MPGTNQNVKVCPSLRFLLETREDVENGYKTCDEKILLVQPRRKLPVQNPDYDILIEIESELRKSYPMASSKPEKPQSFVFEGEKRGLALILSNEHFQNEKTKDRSGDEVDRSQLKKLFSDWGFEVLGPDTGTIKTKNLTKDEMVGVTEKVAEDKRHKEADSFICAILSHGNQEEHEGILYSVIKGVDGGSVRVSKLVEPFLQSKFLRDKPKIFFIQACRGKKIDHGVPVPVNGDNIDGTPPELSSNHGSDSPDPVADIEGQQQNPHGVTESFSNLNVKEKEHSDYPDPPPFDDSVNLDIDPSYDDYLIMYATYQGYPAFRNDINGSWLVQDLQKNLNNYTFTSEDTNGTKSLLRLLTSVNYDVSTRLSSAQKKMGGARLKQMSVIVTTLTKEIFMRQHKIKCP